MQFENVFLGRRSIRRYKDKKVPTELIGEIIDLARFTPSSGNLQNWRFIVVTNQKKRQQLADASMQQDWMVEAPVHIVVCNNFEVVKEHYGKLGKMYSIQNCANAAHAITLIAYDKGLATCWVGGFDSEAVQRTLGIPDNIDPEVIITMGYADETKDFALRDDARYMTYFDNWGKGFTEFPSHLENLKKKFEKIKKG